MTRVIIVSIRVRIIAINLIEPMGSGRSLVPTQVAFIKYSIKPGLFLTSALCVGKKVDLSLAKVVKWESLVGPSAPVP